MRQAAIHRKTGETDISVNLSIDGSGRFEGTTGIGFFDHMMNLLACHSGREIWKWTITIPSKTWALPLAMPC